MQTATVTVTTGDKSDLMLRALRAALTVARLTSRSCSCSSSCRPKALMACMDSRPCCTTATISDCSLRTSWVAFFTAFLKRETKSSRKGVTPTAIRVKSQFSQNIKTNMQTMVSRSTRMFKVEDDANPWMVWMSVVMVLSMVPVWWVL